MSRTLTVEASWKGTKYTLSVSVEEHLLTLKRMLYEKTRVLPVRQKLIGLKAKEAGLVMVDETCLDSFREKDGLIKIMLVGTPEEEIFIYEEHKEEIEPEEVEEELVQVDLSKDVVVIEKLNRVISVIDIALIHPPRKGKKLLVLDLDYTIFDMKSSAPSFIDLKRPFTDEFLTAAYTHFDIVVWSQTSWRWLELKLTELGLLAHPGFKISFVLDKTSMFKVASKRKGKSREHHVKPLQIIWSKLTDYYHPGNTIHVDDLVHNFALNPRNGIRVKAFKNAAVNRASDVELVLLTQYILTIQNMDDLSLIDHQAWKSSLRK